jgi:hypothetical protein
MRLSLCANSFNPPSRDESCSMHSQSLSTTKLMSSCAIIFKVSRRVREMLLIFSCASGSILYHHAYRHGGENDAHLNLLLLCQSAPLNSQICEELAQCSGVPLPAQVPIVDGFAYTTELFLVHLKYLCKSIRWVISTLFYTHITPRYLQCDVGCKLIFGGYKPLLHLMLYVRKPNALMQLPLVTTQWDWFKVV